MGVVIDIPGMQQIEVKRDIAFKGDLKMDVYYPFGLDAKSRAAVPYFTHPTTYDTTNAQRALGAPPPRFGDYIDRLVAFARAHPEIGAAAMA